VLLSGHMLIDAGFSLRRHVITVVRKPDGEGHAAC